MPRAADDVAGDRRHEPGTVGVGPLDRGGRHPVGVLGAGFAHHGDEARGPVLRAADLVAVRGIGDSTGGEAVDVAHARVEVDAVRRDREVLSLHGEHGHAVAGHRLEHHLGVERTVREVHPLHHGMPGRAVLDDPTAEVGETGIVRRGPRRVVGDDRVVHQVRHRAAPVAVEAEREHAEHEGLEVEHEVAADDVGVAEARSQEQPWRLERAAGEDHVPGRHLVLDEVGVEVSDAGGHRPGAVEEHVGHDRLGADLAPTGAQRVPQWRDGVALGVDRAAEEAAEPAVVACGPLVVLDAVHTGRRAVRVVAELRGRFAREHGAVHVGAGRHRVGIGAPRGVRVLGVVTRHADGALGRGVVRLELVVVERPVDDLRTLDRPELRPRVEVDLAEAGELAVGVEPTATDGRREVVHLAGEQAVAVGLAAAEGAGLEERVGTEVVAAEELDLVVRHVPERFERRVEREEVVAALLEHDHRPPRGGEHLGGSRPGRSGADDHHVTLRHR